MKFRLTLFLLSFLLITACSSARKSHSESDEKSGSTSTNHALDEKIWDSSIDIQYVLGRDHHRFLAIARDKTVVANTFLEKQILEEGLINQERYPEFLKKASSFVQATQKNPSSLFPCRSPFTVTVRIGSETQAVHGCRSSDDGSLSKLVRDGEFLLYSKN